MIQPALHLDFRKKRNQWPLLGLILLVIASVFAYWVWQQQQQFQHEYDDVQQQLAKLERQRVQHQMPAKKSQSQVSPEDVLQAQIVTRQLAFPWEPLFNTLEKTSNPDIALLSLQPDTKKLQIKIDGEAKDFKTVLAYISQLQASPVFNQIYLIKHEVNEADKQRPIDFTLVANWQSPT